MYGISRQSEISRTQNGLGGQEGTDGNALVTADWVVDGSWYVVVASKGNLPDIVGATDPTRWPGPDDVLPAETITSGDWTIRLVEPEPDIQSVCISLSAGAIGCGNERPA